MSIHNNFENNMDIMEVLKKCNIDNEILKNVEKELGYKNKMENRDIDNEIKNKIQRFLNLYIPSCKQYEKGRCEKEYNVKNYMYNFLGAYCKNHKKCYINENNYPKVLCYYLDVTTFDNETDYDSRYNEKTIIKKKDFLDIKIVIKNDRETITFPKRQLEEYLEELGKLILEKNKRYFVYSKGYKRYGKYIALVFENAEIYNENEWIETEKNRTTNKNNKNGKMYDVKLMDENIHFEGNYILNPFDCENIYYVIKRDCNEKTKESGLFMFVDGDVRIISDENINLSEEAKEGLNMINVIDPTNYY